MTGVYKCELCGHWILDWQSFYINYQRLCENCYDEIIQEKADLASKEYIDEEETN